MNIKSISIEWIFYWRTIRLILANENRAAERKNNLKATSANNKVLSVRKQEKDEKALKNVIAFQGGLVREQQEIRKCEGQWK